ncbi:MAG: hypothetical protein ACRDXX_08680 [Stackebrandtia sp.]
MISLDDLITALDACLEKAAESEAATDSAKSTSGEVSAQVEAWGLEGSARRMRAVERQIEELKPHLAAFKSACAEAKSAVIAEKGGGLTAGAASGATPREARRFDPQPHLDQMPVMKPRSERKLGEAIPKTHGRWAGGEEGLTEWVSGSSDEHAERAKRVWQRTRRLER